MKVLNLIDAAYLFDITRKLGGSFRTDVGKLVQFMSSEHFLVRTYYYDAMPHCSQHDRYDWAMFDGKQRYIDFLKSSIKHFSVKMGSISVAGEFRQKRVDSMINLDLMHFARNGNIDIINLVAGDEDFLDAVCEVKYAGAVLKLWHGPICSRLLMEEADDKFLLNETSLFPLRDLTYAPKTKEVDDNLKSTQEQQTCSALAQI